MVINRFIQHRINTVAQLKTVPAEVGIELDLRSNGNDIILHHDPFSDGERFDEFLKSYHHSYLILNTKEEGLEKRLTGMMEEHNISEYFFLDLSLPFLVKTARSGCTKIAVRFSEYEPLEFVARFAGLAEWVWVDCFNDLILTSENYGYLKEHFKICLVSPELQGHPLETIADHKKRMEGFVIDAVCTKRIDLWK